MIQQLIQHITGHLEKFTEDDILLFGGERIPLKKELFSSLQENKEHKKIAFVDGGQAELLAAGNFSLSLLRIAVVTFCGTEQQQTEFYESYLFTTATVAHGDVIYQNTLFPLRGELLITAADLTVAAKELPETTVLGTSPASKVAEMARRFMELRAAEKAKAEIIVLDGILEGQYPHEKNYLANLPKNVCGIAKSSSLVTLQGNSPIVLLQKIAPQGCWSYEVNSSTAFVKLHPSAQHVFRFSGDFSFLPFLVEHASDPLLLGYPYGLFVADKYARVSNQEKQALRMQLLLGKQSEILYPYLHTQDIHSILDTLS